ncbi:hypothetical protein WJX82_010251 [Trebouxia sp. C0006]
MGISTLVAPSAVMRSQHNLESSQRLGLAPTLDFPPPLGSAPTLGLSPSLGSASTLGPASTMDSSALTPPRPNATLDALMGAAPAIHGIAAGSATREAEQSAEVHWPPPLVLPDILEETVEVPDAYRCPITLTLMREPAITYEGLTYDRPAILRWIEQRKKDPKTAKKLKANHLIPNLILRECMQSWIDKQLHEIGASHLRSVVLSTSASCNLSFTQEADMDPQQSDWAVMKPHVLSLIFQAQHNALDNCAAACVCIDWRDAVQTTPISMLHLHARHAHHHKHWSKFLQSRLSLRSLKLTSSVRQTTVDDTEDLKARGKSCFLHLPNDCDTLFVA